MTPLHQWLGQRPGAAGINLTCAAPAVEIVSPPDPAQELAEAYRAGRAAVAAEAEAARAAQVAASEEACQQRLAAARAAWVRDHGEKMLQQVAAAFAALENEIAAGVADVLKPFLAERVHHRAVAEFTSLLATYTSACGPAALQIKAPEDLITGLKAAMAESASPIVFTAWPNCEIEAVVDGTLLRTDIAGWCAAIGTEHD